MVYKQFGADPGRWAEQRALGLLQENGWHCLAQRWRCRYGEIDLLMVKGDEGARRVLAVEVKARRRCGPDGWGMAAMNRAKRRRLARSIACWMSTITSFEICSLEVVLALVPLPPNAARVRWIPIPEMPWLP